jgi:predicted Zn-dependent protease
VPAASAGLRALIALLLAAAGLLVLQSRREPAPGPAAGPAAVTPGQTSEQALPDGKGGVETWRFSRRELAREDLPALVLPQPSPRRAPPGPAAESARALAGQALEAWKQGEIPRALELFEAAVAADPEDAPPRSDYGRLLMLMADYEAALPQLERAAELRPEDPRVWVDLLTFYERNRLFERAGHARRRAEALAGGRRLVRDETGFWVLEGEKVFP